MIASQRPLFSKEVTSDSYAGGRWGHVSAGIGVCQSPPLTIPALSFSRQQSPRQDDFSTLKARYRSYSSHITRMPGIFCILAI